MQMLVFTKPFVRELGVITRPDAPVERVPEYSPGHGLRELVHLVTAFGTVAVLGAVLGLAVR